MSRSNPPVTSSSFRRWVGTIVHRAALWNLRRYETIVLFNQPRPYSWLYAWKFVLKSELTGMSSLCAARAADHPRGPCVAMCTRSGRLPAQSFRRLPRAGSPILSCLYIGIGAPRTRSSPGCVLCAVSSWRLGRIRVISCPRSRRPFTKIEIVCATPLISGGYVSVTTATRRLGLSGTIRSTSIESGSFIADP